MKPSMFSKPTMGAQKRQTTLHNKVPSSLSINSNNSKSSALTSANILTLQRTIGNQAVKRLVSKADKPSIQRMPAEQFRTQVEKTARENLASKEEGEIPSQVIEKWSTEFIHWMEQEYQKEEARGAFDSTEVGTKPGGEPMYKRMYGSLYDYINDKAFDEKILKGYLLDFIDQRAKGFPPDFVLSAQERHVSSMGLLATDGLEWINPTKVVKGNVVEMARLPFSRWLAGTGSDPGQMNCWEAVLYAAHNAGIISKEYIKAAIEFVPAKDLGADWDPPRFIQKILGSPAGQRINSSRDTHDLKSIAIPLTSPIPRGSVVVFGQAGQHVALATGTIENIARNDAQGMFQQTQGHGIWELDKATTGVEKTTIEDVMARNTAYSISISWGPLPSFTALQT